METVPSGANAASSLNSTSTVPQSFSYSGTSGMYYPYYFPSTLSQTTQGGQLYNPMLAGMNPQLFMNQFAQFMSMMTTGQLPQVPQTAPVIRVTILSFVGD